MIYIKTRVTFEILALNTIWKQYVLSATKMHPKPQSLVSYYQKYEPVCQTTYRFTALCFMYVHELCFMCDHSQNVTGIVGVEGLQDIIIQNLFSLCFILGIDVTSSISNWNVVHMQLCPSQSVVLIFICRTVVQYHTYVGTDINYIGQIMYVQTRVTFEILTFNTIWKRQQPVATQICLQIQSLISCNKAVKWFTVLYTSPLPCVLYM